VRLPDADCYRLPGNVGESSAEERSFVAAVVDLRCGQSATRHRKSSQQVGVVALTAIGVNTLSLLIGLITMPAMINR
jgi:hypothetical protein